MIKTKSFLGIICLVFILLSAQNIFAWWNFDVVARKVNGLRQNRSLVIGNDGTIHIVYVDSDLDRTHRSIRHAYKDGLVWQTEMIPETQNLYWGGDIVLDSHGKLHMIFLGSTYNIINPESECIIYYATNSSGFWVTERVVSYISEEPHRVSKLVLDSNDNPHISYIPFPRDLRYAYKDSTGWHTEIVHEDYLYNSLMVLDSSDNPHIIYEGGTGRLSEKGQLEHAYKNSTGWHTEIINEDDVQWISEPLYSNDTLHILYEGEYQLRYACKDSTGWHTEIINEGGGFTTPMILDSRGNPLYTLSLGHHPVFYFVHKDETGWHTEVIDEPGDYTLKSIKSMALDSDDNPHIIYSCRKRHYLGGTFQFHAEYILKYAKRVGARWHIETVDRAHAFAVWWIPYFVNVFGNNIDISGDSSFAIDLDGNPHIIYAKNCYNHFESIFFFGTPASPSGITSLKHATRFDFVD